jgi:hypothetical protein
VVDERGVTELLDRLRQAEVLAWLDGGWGVDALLGEQTGRTRSIRRRTVAVTRSSSTASRGGTTRRRLPA